MLAWQKLPPARPQRNASKELHKLDKKLQDTFPKFFYKQKVLEEMIVVAGNIHEKFKASLRHIAGTGSAAANQREQQAVHSRRAHQDQGAGTIRAHAAARNSSRRSIS